MLVGRMVWFSVRGMGIVCSEYVERAVLAEVSALSWCMSGGESDRKGLSVRSGWSGRRTVPLEKMCAEGERGRGTASAYAEELWQACRKALCEDKIGTGT